MYQDLIKNLKLLTENVIFDLTKSINILGLSARQAEYLEIINSTENCTPKFLAEFFQIRKPTVTSGINFLLENGLVKKIQSGKDKRVFFLTLTNKGENKLKKIQKEKEDIVNKYLQPLNSKEIKQLSWIVNKIILISGLK